MNPKCKISMNLISKDICPNKIMSSQDINIFNIIEEEEEEHSDDKNTTSLVNTNTEEERHETNNINIQDIFSLNANEAMAKKSLNPSMTVIISIEADSSQVDDFWNDKSVLDTLSPDFIIVRLSQTKNFIEIMQFSSIFIIKAVPSLYIFGPFSQGISYAWSERYPTPSEFVQYVHQKLQNKNQTQVSSTNFSDLIIQNHLNSSAIPNSQTEQLSPSITNQQEIPTSTYSHPLIYSNSNDYQQSQNTNFDNNNNIISQNNNHNDTELDLNLDPIRTHSTSNTIQKQKSSTTHKSNARISVQLNGQHTNFEFSRDAPVIDIVKAIESKFGRSYELYVPHLHRCISFATEELNKSIASADLAPSAMIVLRGPDDPNFSSNSIEKLDNNDGYFDFSRNLNSEVYHPPPSNSEKQFTSNAGDDATPSLEIEENLPTLGHTDTPEVVPSHDVINNDDDENNGRRTTENGCGWSLIKKILSIVNPFGDIEEVEDFFETKEFRT